MDVKVLRVCCWCEHEVELDVDGDGAGEVRRVMAGEGIAIGRWPCEFHRREYACEE